MVYSKNPQSPKLKYPFQSLEARDFEAAHLIFCCLKHIRLPLIEAFFNYGVVIDSPKKPSGVFSLTKQHCETCSFSMHLAMGWISFFGGRVWEVYQNAGPHL